MKKYLLSTLLTLGVTACGNYVDIDADPKKPGKEEGKTSTAETESPQVKLKAGMTKKEARGILGDPASVREYDSYTVWDYDYEEDKDKCGSYVCYLNFNARTGLLDRISGISPKYMDVEE